jgi:uncharacterized protein (TIGR03435 family)
MMIMCAVRRRAFCRGLLAGLACFCVGIVLLLITALPAQRAGAQATPAANPKDIADTWQGTLHAGQDLRTLVKITKADGDGYKAVFYSIDQGGQPLPVDSIMLEGSTVKMSLKMINGTFEGRLREDGKTIDGNWSQGPTPLPLVLERVTPDEAWAIPPPPKQMSADARPVFEVVTIKLSQTQQGRNWGVRGSHVQMTGGTLEGLVDIAYGLHAKQILNAPDWFSSYRFDIDGVPNLEGRPSQDQIKEMFQALLADRFKLVFHHDKKELAVYAITVAKGGPRLTKSPSEPTDGPGFLFTNLGVLHARNNTMVDFANGMQRAVTDKPVVDQRGLTDRYDFNLVWTPDETQFSGLGAKVPPPTADDPNSPPSLYTAIQEQLGLKLEATRAMDDVFVIDHVEKPSEN